jgi:two-component sensor histidine kinase
MPVATNGRDVLKGAIGSLETMIGDLRERELKHEPEAQLQEDLIEVIIAEVVNEQRVALSKDKTQIKFVMNDRLLHFVSTPREELKRILTNLIVNSAEAIETDGQIEIETKECGNSRISIKITDNGIGFSEEALKNLFKKGFTTKPNGSGRGLSFAQKKVREWDGRLLVESIPGHTVIEITLPATRTDHLVHPSILNEATDIVAVDDHPLDLSPVLSVNARLKSFESLGRFQRAYRQGNISSDSLIVFDLHLEEGRRAFEALPDLKANQDYLFMTSDYLNPELTSEAKKRQFLTIPKELISFGLKDEEHPAIAGK